MTLQPFTKEQVNYFIFAHIVTNEFPKALRQSFKYLWDTTYGHRPGYRSWDDSKEVREMFLREEGSTTDVPTNLSYTEWDCSKLFQATIYSQSFSEEDSEGRKTSLSDKYVKPHRLAEGELLTSIGKSSTSVTETFTIAINQLRILRDNLLRLTKAEIDTKTFGSYIQLSEKAFGFLNVATASIKAISSYSEDDFPTEKARKIGEDIMNYMGTESGHIRDKILKGCEVLAAESLHITEERNKELLERIIEIFVNREKVVHKLFELIKSGASPSDTGDFEPVSEKISETENEKRWSVTVIALQKILFQHIRPHVKQRMLQIYGEESYVEDCKKILRKRSGHYYGDIKSFDEFDLGAILKLLSDFDSPSHCPGAIGVIDVRNNLAHADYNQWDKAKLDKSFRAMEKLVTEMRLPGEDQRELLESLRYLEEKGEMLLSNYGAKTSLENQVKQLRDDVNDKLEYVGTSLVSIASVLREEKKLDQQLIEGEPKLTEDTSSEGLGEMLLSNYDAKTSLENQVKQLRDDVNDKLEYVRASLVSIASVVRDEKKPDQQLIEGETKLTEDTSSERQEKSLSRSKIGEVKDSTSLEEVSSVLKGKQQTEEQRGEDESESFEETLDENQATSPSTIYKGKDSTSPEEVISVPVDKQQTEEQSGEDESELFKETHSVGPETSLSRLKIGDVKDPTSLEEVTSVPKDKQQTEEQSGEDESESFEETLGENQATSPSTIDKGTNLTSLEEVISVPMDKQQTEEQSEEDKTESFEEMLGVGPGAQDHDIKGKTTTFEAEHKECIRVLPYTNASGQVYVQLYVFCDKNSVPVELKEAAQEFFGETGVELRWTNLYNYASNIPNIVSKDFKQLEVSQANVISKIINKNLPVFSKHRNITAVQPSLKVTNSKQTKHPCIRVYVLGKGCIPVGESEIPNAVENFLVDIVDGFWLETLDSPKPLTAHKQEKCLRLGASIGVRGAKTAGTLGAIVRDDSKFYLLSCDHVINHEWENEIIHPGGTHYLASLKYHLTEYQNWINRIIEPENRLKDSNLMPKKKFEHLKNQVDSFYNAPDVPRHPNLEECERKLDELFSEKPRTVAYYTDGVRENMKIPGGSECFIDVAVAELTYKEVQALREKGYVEIIDTTNYPDGNVSRDGSQNRTKEWCKSGSSTGYTTLKSHYYLENVFLKTTEHERPSGEDMWRVNCLFFPHNQNVFSDLGDSGAVIFEKSEGQPEAMSGFGIVLGVISSEVVCGTVAAPLFGALDLLYEKLGRRFTLVSTF